MSSPAKRRKKNDSQPSPQKAGSLDFFFGKQKNDLVTKVEGVAEKRQAITAPPVAQVKENENGRLTDEELARQLQDEWNREEAGPGVGIDNPQPKEEVGRRLQDKIGSSGAPKAIPDALSEKGDALNKGLMPPRKKATLSLQSAAAVEDAVTSEIPFDENPLVYDPQAHLPGLKACWASEGGSATYGLLTRCFILVNSTQSRIKIVDTLVNLLRTIIEGDPESLLPMACPTDLHIICTD